MKNSLSGKIEVIYICESCGEHKLEVPERAQVVDIALWMDLVKQYVGRDHAVRNCPADTFDLKIPFAQGELVGRNPKPPNREE